MQGPSNSKAALSVALSCNPTCILPLLLPAGPTRNKYAAHQQIYKVAKQWEGLPSADEMVAVQRREKRLREKRRVQREAAAAGVPVPHPQQQQQLAALPAPDSAAAAAAGEGGDDDDEPIEVVAELSVDQVGVDTLAAVQCRLQQQPIEEQPWWCVFVAFGVGECGVVGADGWLLLGGRGTSRVPGVWSGIETFVAAGTLSAAGAMTTCPPAADLLLHVPLRGWTPFVCALSSPSLVG